MKSLKREACRGQLMSLALFSLEKKRLSGILMQSSTFPVMEVEDQALVYALSWQAIEHKQMKLHQRNFRWSIRKMFFTETVVGYRNSPGEVVKVPVLPNLKKHLDNAFSHMVLF